MKKMILAMCATALVCGCTNKGEVDNPFLSDFSTPFGVPAFDEIKPEHYMPAFELGMEQQKAEIEAIVNNNEPATFENTIVALDQSGALLNKVSYVFFAQNSACTDSAMQAISRELSPKLSKHSDDINLNPALFAKVKEVYETADTAALTKEQKKLLQETYKGFVRSGANLDSLGQAKLRELNSEISLLQLTFSQNMLAETNAFQLFIEDEKDLAGLPQSLIDNAAEAAAAAAAAGQQGKWLFTLHNPSVMPFLQYAENRDLRQKMYEGYINRGNNNNENDNKEVVRKLVEARIEKAKLMGYHDYATLALETRMAKTTEAVCTLFDQVWPSVLKKANEELNDIKAEIRKEGKNFEPMGWDWSYYANKAKQAKYAMDENELRPYLKLENVRDGMFLLANKLYGVTFTQVDSIPLPHPEATAFECKDQDGTHLGLLYLDFFPRASKRGGAWCGRYRNQTYADGHRKAPIVTVVCNFSKPAAGQPSLLTADEASTMFHEFGHALHSLFADVHYYGVASVPRDFVELPSQVMEHWVFEPEMLALYAKHYETGEVMPTALVEKLEKSGKYGQGFATAEYWAAAWLDMEFHLLNELPEGFDVMAFEKQVMDEIKLPKQIAPRYRTTYFNHTMGGGYTAGYYSYFWSEVLDADAYEAFKETGDIFNKDVAAKFRECVLTPGCIEDADVMYHNFRGATPSIEPVLKNRGLK